MLTARELADRVREVRQGVWQKSDPSVAMISTRKMNPEDEREVRRTVAAAGYKGVEQDEMIHQVSSLLIGQVEALNDDMPVEAGD